MLKLALLIAATAAAEAPRSAEPGSQAPPAAAARGGRSIDTFEQVRDLCAALKSGKPVAEVVVNVPSKAFNFGRHRPTDSEIELDGDRPLRAAEGTLVLDVQGIDDVAFRGSAEQVARWKKAKEAGALHLQLELRPSEDGCRGSQHARQFRLGAFAQSWRLVANEKDVVAAADDEGRPLARTDGSRAAKVTSVALEDEAPADDDGRSKLASAQRALDDCARRAQKPGSLVISFAAAGGTVSDVQVVVDGIRDAAVTGCFAQALNGAQVDGRGKGTVTINVE